MISMTKKIMNIIVLTLMIVCCSVTVNSAIAQRQKNPQQIFANIYTAYDSIPYLSFDVKYTYASDGVNDKSANESLKGSYKMSGKNALYNIGNIQFMQNDSFFIAVYNDNKSIIVTNPHVAHGSNLPMRSMMDSILHSYSAHYTISFKKVSDTTSAVNFVRADSLAQFDKLTIVYLSKNKAFLRSISYKFKIAAALDGSHDSTIESGTASQQPTYYTKSLTIDFTNYRFDSFSDNLYDQSNYISFDNGTWKPVNKYKGFKIYDSRTTFINKQ